METLLSKKDYSNKLHAVLHNTLCVFTSIDDTILMRTWCKNHGKHLCPAYNLPIIQSSYTNQRKKSIRIQDKAYGLGVKQIQLLVRGYKMNTIFDLVFKFWLTCQFQIFKYITVHRPSFYRTWVIGWYLQVTGHWQTFEDMPPPITLLPLREPSVLKQAMQSNPRIEGRVIFILCCT